MYGEAVFQIAKMVGGRDVWLTEAAPSIVWGCRTKAIKFACSNDAREALAAMPLSERDTAIMIIGN